MPMDLSVPLEVDCLETSYSLALELQQEHWQVGSVAKTTATTEKGKKRSGIESRQSGRLSMEVETTATTDEGRAEITATTDEGRAEITAATVENGVTLAGETTTDETDVLRLMTPIGHDSISHYLTDFWTVQWQDHLDLLFRCLEFRKSRM
jgi:hypothetical protein